MHTVFRPPLARCFPDGCASGKGLSVHDDLFGFELFDTTQCQVVVLCPFVPSRTPDLSDEVGSIDAEVANHVVGKKQIGVPVRFEIGSDRVSRLVDLSSSE